MQRVALQLTSTSWLQASSLSATLTPVIFLHISRAGELARNSPQNSVARPGLQHSRGRGSTGPPTTFTVATTRVDSALDPVLTSSKEARSGISQSASRSSITLLRTETERASSQPWSVGQESPWGRAAALISFVEWWRQAQPRADTGGKDTLLLEVPRFPEKRDREGEILNEGKSVSNCLLIELTSR